MATKQMIPEWAEKLSQILPGVLGQCPECHGKGTLNGGDYLCHICDGQGSMATADGLQLLKILTKDRGFGDRFRMEMWRNTDKWWIALWTTQGEWASGQGDSLDEAIFMAVLRRFEKEGISGQRS